ncbi:MULTISPECIES: hypothetical protein [unclassified Pseudomonas]|uniref:hypothetical protein n=1 Tax=unclassified Pseudomonas TaxID=196821 RepID=UPI001CC19B6E|nr:MULTISPECIES: hypothetical protein [unclassified Pseudomonas]
MTIYSYEHALWEAVAVGYLLQNQSGGTREEAAVYAGKLADALVLEKRKRERA